MQDDDLILAVNTFGSKDWKKVAEVIGIGLSNDQCQMRWSKHVKPRLEGLPTSKWSSDEVSTTLFLKNTFLFFTKAMSDC